MDDRALFLDTNVLLSWIGRILAEGAEREPDIALIDAGDNALSLQICRNSMYGRPNQRVPTPHTIVATCLVRARLRRKIQNISASTLTGGGN